VLGRHHHRRRLEARISIDGKVSGIHEVSLYELLAVLDEAARFVSENGIR
jgi:hypothetical protein